MDRFVELPLKPDDVSRVGGIPASEIAEAYMRRTEMYYGDGIRCVIDKSPSNVFVAGIIARAMPEAKILCLVRGPMDTAYSNLRQLFQNGAFAYSYDQRQLADRYALFQAVVAHWQERLPSNFLAVSYESLVEDPITVGRAVFEFCGLEFDPAFVDITRNTSPSATASASQIRSPIHQRGVGEWLRYEAPAPAICRPAAGAGCFAVDRRWKEVEPDAAAVACAGRRSRPARGLGDGGRGPAATRPCPAAVGPAVA